MPRSPAITITPTSPRRREAELEHFAHLPSPTPSDGPAPMRLKHASFDTESQVIYKKPIPPLVSAALVTHFMSFLLYRKGQIPSTVSQLKTQLKDAKKSDKVARDLNKVLHTLRTIDEQLAACKAAGIKEAVVFFGKTAQRPTELYHILIETADDGAEHPTVPYCRKLAQTLTQSDTLPMRYTPDAMHVMVLCDTGLAGELSPVGDREFTMPRAGSVHRVVIGDNAAMARQGSTHLSLMKDEAVRVKLNGSIEAMESIDEEEEGKEGEAEAEEPAVPEEPKLTEEEGEGEAEAGIEEEEAPAPTPSGVLGWYRVGGPIRPVRVGASFGVYK